MSWMNRANGNVSTHWNWSFTVHCMVGLDVATDIPRHRIAFNRVSALSRLRAHDSVRPRTRDAYPKATSTIADNLEWIIKRRYGHQRRVQERSPLRRRGGQVAPHADLAYPASRCITPSLIFHCNPNVICVWTSQPCFIPSFPSHSFNPPPPKCKKLSTHSLSICCNPLWPSEILQNNFTAQDNSSWATN